MSGRQLAEDFAAANQRAVDYVLGSAREHWQQLTAAEGWPVGVTARHIALGHLLVASWLRAVHRGEPVRGLDRVDDANATEAARGVVATPEQVAALLRANGRPVLAALHALSDAELAAEVDFGGRRMPAATVAGAAVRHIERHLASLEQAVTAGAGRAG